MYEKEGPEILPVPIPPSSIAGLILIFQIFADCDHEI